jgi:D-glycero-alpha-D-manno-heptose-7-phosphate kinase
MIIIQTPFRVSFAGGGTDFPDYYRTHGGCAVTTAIDKFVYCIVKKRFDEKIFVNYSRKEIVDTVDEIQHELVREAMRKVGVEKGVEISFLADIAAEGSGLGSSSSVTVSVLHALYTLIRESPSAEQLAREACEIELEILGKPIGVQDQYIAAYGGFRRLTFGPGDKIQIEKVDAPRGSLDDLESSMMMFFTGRTRKAASILTEQKSGISTNLQMLGKIAGFADEAFKFIHQGAVESLGALLDESWRIKRSLAKAISDPELDSIYERAMQAGALGGKILGAGGGGFFLFCVPSGRRQAVRDALSELWQLPFRFEQGGSRVLLNVEK